MNKLDEQLIEMVLKNHTYFQYGALMHAKDMDFAKKFISQIKQSILKAIMEGKPKESHINYHIEDGIEYRDQNDIPVSISWEKGYNRALQEFESVIKEVLSK